MPRRKQEVYDERRGQIIDGALRVFSTKGFFAATNKDVAEAAGINSPGLIYHYFGSKEDLLRAVVEKYAPPLQLLAHAEELRALPPAEALSRLGMAYVRLVDDPKIGSGIKLFMAEALRDPQFAATIGEVGPLRILRFLTIYLNELMEKNVLRRMDPRIAARCFMGPLVLHLLAKNVLQVPELTDIDPAALVAAQVDIFLRGMQPDR